MGLLYAAIPKTMELLHEGNCRFYVRIRYAGAWIPISGEFRLPLINYYNTSMMAPEIDRTITRVPGNQDAGVEIDNEA